MMKLIYVSAPYTADTRYERQRNVSRARNTREWLQRQDPDNWYTCPVGELPEDWDYDKCMKHCLARLAKCDEAIFCKGWTISDGCRKEYIFAAKHGIPRRALLNDGSLLSQEETDRCL